MNDNILFREDITENIIAIKINRSYSEDITEAGLYDITRGYWKISVKKAAYIEYAFSVYKGTVKEVYKIEKWLPAGSVPRPTLPNAEVPEGRYEFIGNIAEDNIRNKYIGKSMANLYRKGEANPIKYFFNINAKNCR